MMLPAHHFTIDNTEFGIGSVTLSVDPADGAFTLEIVGDATLATAIGANETHPFNWIIYPPKFYVRQAVLVGEGNAKTLDIDDDALDEYDIALYLIEHNDVFGRLTLANDGLVRFSGTTSIDGAIRPLDISCLAVPTP